jgi:glycosyltransferase involved in cell wall biosynthesis
MSESEGLPVSMMEAISFGIPILAIDCMGVKELVNEKVGAVFLKETSNEKIASGLVGILNEVSRNMEKRIAIRQYWREKFSDTNYNKFYDHVASSLIRFCKMTH